MSSNPYDPPNADLASEPSQPRAAPGIGWKLYFLLMVIAVLSTALYVAFRADPTQSRYPRQVLSVVLCLTSTIGVGGYVFQKKLIRARFWRYILYLYLLNVAFGCVSALIGVYESTKSIMGVWPMLLGFSIGALLALPGYIALYRYGSPNEYPWRGKKN